jgi:hypothetical protein
MGPPRKVLICVKITKEQDNALRVLSTSTRVPMAVYVRDALDLFLRQRGISVSASGDADTDLVGLDVE